MWGEGALLDNNADGAEGTIPYKYLDFYRFVWMSEEKNSSRGGGAGVYNFEECVVFVRF